MYFTTRGPGTASTSSAVSQQQTQYALSSQQQQQQHHAVSSSYVHADTSTNHRSSGLHRHSTGPTSGGRTLPSQQHPFHGSYSFGGSESGQSLNAEPHLLRASGPQRSMSTTHPSQQRLLLGEPQPQRQPPQQRQPVEMMISSLRTTLQTLTQSHRDQVDSHVAVQQSLTYLGQCVQQMIEGEAKETSQLQRILDLLQQQQQQQCSPQSRHRYAQQPSSTSEVLASKVEVACGSVNETQATDDDSLGAAFSRAGWRQK